MQLSRAHKWVRLRRGMLFAGGRGGGVAEKQVSMVGACIGVWGHASQEILFHFCVIFIAEWGETGPPSKAPRFRRVVK